MGVLLIVLTFVLPGGVVAGTRKLKAKILRIVPRTPDGDLAVDADADETPDELGSATA